jgi:Gas vesicle synthesis protein GvpL/GvpF
MKFVAIGVHLRREDVEPLASAVPVENLFLSALEVPAEQNLADRELLLRVANVRAQLLERATFIAIRYGFTFTNDAQSKVGTFLSRWRALLAEHRGRVEMTLKVAAAAAASRPDRREFTSGADYLRALHAAREAASVDGPFRQQVDHLLVPLTVAHRWSHRDEKSLELAMLAERASLDEIRAAGEQLRATRVPFLLSGPWPLEVFAE